MRSLVHVLVYGFIGMVMLAGGLGTFVMMAGWLPDFAAELGGGTTHLPQEFGSAMICLGLLALWCSANATRARLASSLLLLFFVLISMVHWLDFAKGNVPLASPLMNTAPTMLLAVVHYIEYVRGHAQPSA